MQKSIIIFIVGLVVGAALSGGIVQIRADRNYSDLETRYLTIEGANIKLREENQRLIDNNIELGREQRESAELINGAKSIIGEFQGGINDSQDTIDRIERGITALEQIVNILCPEGQE